MVGWEEGRTGALNRCAILVSAMASKESISFPSTVRCPIASATSSTYLYGRMEAPAGAILSKLMYGIFTSGIVEHRIRLCRIVVCLYRCKVGGSMIHFQRKQEMIFYIIIPTGVGNQGNDLSCCQKRCITLSERGAKRIDWFVKTHVVNYVLPRQIGPDVDEITLECFQPDAMTQQVADHDVPCSKCIVQSNLGIHFVTLSSSDNRFCVLK